MSEGLTILKGRGLLYSKFLERLYLALENIPNNSKKDYLPYKEFRTRLPKSFQISKYDSMEVLLILKDLGFVSLSKRGVKLNFRLKGDEI